MKDEKLYAERDHRDLKPRYSGDISAITAEDLREKGDILDKLVRREEGGDDMTHTELLELAGKAIGIKKDDSPYNGGGIGNTGFDMLGNLVTDWHNGTRWNPLDDDGDALRLAVELRIKVEFGNDEVTTDWPVSERYTTRPDGASSIEGRCAATRRAIVRAAAEIGRQMEEAT